MLDNVWESGSSSDSDLFQEAMNSSVGDAKIRNTIWAQDQRVRERIKSRMIGLERLTSLKFLELDDPEGRLGPHTSLYIETGQLSMHIPTSPTLPRTYIPAISQSLGAATKSIHEDLYPPTGL